MSAGGGPDAHGPRPPPPHRPAVTTGARPSKTAATSSAARRSRRRVSGVHEGPRANPDRALVPTTRDEDDRVERRHRGHGGVGASPSSRRTRSPRQLRRRACRREEGLNDAERSARAGAIAPRPASGRRRGQRVGDVVRERARGDRPPRARPPRRGRAACRRPRSSPPRAGQGRTSPRARRDVRQHHRVVGVGDSEVIAFGPGPQAAFAASYGARRARRRGGPGRG